MADTNINVSALNPEFWANMLQVPLRKSLVSEAVADTQFEPLLKYGDTVNQPYINETSSESYTPGKAFTAKGTTATQDTLTVDNYRIVPDYVDDINALQSKYKYSMDLIDNQAYQLRDDIDTHVFTNITAAGNFLYSDSTAQNSIASTDTLATATGNSKIKVHSSDSDATAVSPTELFSHARKKLRTENVAEAGDWIAVIDPNIAQMIEMYATDKGFSVADATLRNGYVGGFLGFKVYTSNNLPSDWAYFGKSKRIALVVQMPPKVQIKDVSDKLGVNIVTSVVYGSNVFTKNADRFLGVYCESA